MKTLLSKQVKEEIIEALKDYAKGEVYLAYPDAKRGHTVEEFKKGVQPYYHNSKLIVKGIRRFRFNIAMENDWNKINLNPEQIVALNKKVQDILKANGIRYEDAGLKSYAPYLSSRPQYEPWYRCFDILVKEE